MLIKTDWNQRVCIASLCGLGINDTVTVVWGHVRCSLLKGQINIWSRLNADI